MKQQYPHYFCKPVPVFGDDTAQLLIVGLAPGLHGANATGRPFTGDASGEWLFRSLHKFGFSTHPVSNADDQLQLNNCRITNAVKCLPPQNKPLNTEIVNCNAFFKDELQGLPDNAIVLALGTIAHNAVLRATDNRLSAYKFGHAQVHQLERFVLLDSY
ncbi:MAG: uracil-DNA glycosylase family protein, partial [Thiotrichaceae bacterium]